jgi:uroporphyrinogen-III synthase
MKAIENILITSTSDAFQPIEAWAKQYEVNLIFQPFIRIDPILKLKIPATDWIFFSSPKGARAYLDHYPIKANKIAVFGKGTERIISHYNLSADFKGDSHQSPAEIGHTFESLLKPEEEVLFPIGNRSRKTIINALKSATFKTIEIYNTINTSTKLIQHPDCILFTSPSNFEGFLIDNELSEETQLIAMGETTADTIRQRLDHKKLHVLESPTAVSLLNFLK